MVESAERTERSSSKDRLVAVALAFAGFSIIWSRAAPFALAFAFVAYLTAAGATAPRLRHWLAVGAGALALMGLLRFTVREALTGIVESGKRASGVRAVSHLRQLSFAQDVMREQAEIDPDHDRIGSAAFIEELAGRTAVRGKSTPISAPMTMARGASLLQLPAGPCLRLDGYCFIVCLPTKTGGWVFDPKQAGEVDEERAERRFVAYAWPAEAQEGLSESVFIDEHERILVHVGNGSDIYAGQRYPHCDAALLRPENWKPWRNKRPRTALPGERGD